MANDPLTEFEKNLLNRSAERRQKLSADIVALTLDEVAAALRLALDQTSTSAKSESDD